MHEPPELPAEDQLQALEEELAGLVAAEMASDFPLNLSLLARYAASFTEVVSFIDIVFDEPLGFVQQQRGGVEHFLVATTYLDAMTTFAVAEAALQIPSFCAAFVAFVAVGEAMQFPPFPTASHFGGGGGDW